MKKIRKVLEFVQFLLKLLEEFPLTWMAEVKNPGEISAAFLWVVEGALGQVVELGKKATASYQHCSVTGSPYRNTENFEVIE